MDGLLEIPPCMEPGGRAVESASDETRHRTPDVGPSGIALMAIEAAVSARALPHPSSQERPSDVRCAICGYRIRANGALGIAYCPVHGLAFRAR
jgi:hypothetical protein